MARRNRTDAPADSTDEATEPTTEEAVTATTTETPVEADVATPAESSDSTTAPAEATPAKKEIDLSGFTTAVTTAVAERDTTTGDLAVAAIEPVVKAYRELDGIAAKNKGKVFLTDAMRDAMNAMDMPLARSFMVLQDNLSAGSTGGGPKTPADPTQAYVERVVGLDLARALIFTPEGLSDDVDAKVQELYGSSYDAAETYKAWLLANEDTRGDEPDVPAFVKSALKLAQGKSAKVGGARVGGGSSTGERHDIGEHIRQAFEGVESGTFLTVAEIRKHESTEYGENPPSAGAISARLFPTSGKCTLDFVTPGQNEKANRGATKN